MLDRVTTANYILHHGRIKLKFVYVFNLSTRGKMTLRKCVTRNAPETKFLL